ncbi:hypothetical protein NDU88_006924 [Pleurodeles waltl]|uniref:Uncharacterized protein n=1 Tax=Pleurodeles waltl TaxID=8319 RepID=A0AAV7PMG7_PLEWA|nr:hypothetical protein NDU88_006924 [Pleurodeles waltl]
MTHALACRERSPGACGGRKGCSSRNECESDPPAFMAAECTVYAFSVGGPAPDRSKGPPTDADIRRSGTPRVHTTPIFAGFITDLSSCSPIHGGTATPGSHKNTALEVGKPPDALAPTGNMPRTPRKDAETPRRRLFLTVILWFQDPCPASDFTASW